MDNRKRSATFAVPKVEGKIRVVLETKVFGMSVKRALGFGSRNYE